MVTAAAIEQAKAQLADQGWCILPDVVSGAYAAQGAERLWAAARQNAQDGFSCYLPGVDPNPSMVRVMNPLQSDAFFRDWIQNDVALEMARFLIGEDLIISNSSATIALPGSQPMKLHSDLASILPEPWLAPWSANVILCLSDLHKDNGATLYIPRSHRWQTRTDIPDKAEELLVPFEAAAGSIIVMDGRLWHTSGVNVTVDEERALLFAYYCAPFLRPMINWSAAFSAEEQASFSPLLRRLLALEVFANTYDGEQQDQGHWRGMPVGPEQATAEFERARALRAESLDPA